MSVCCSNASPKLRMKGNSVVFQQLGAKEGDWRRRTSQGDRSKAREVPREECVLRRTAHSMVLNSAGEGWRCSLDWQPGGSCHLWKECQRTMGKETR